MSFTDIVNGDFGQVAQLTFVDTDTDAAADISGYATTIQMIWVDPSGNETAKTATFATDGTDGVIQYTVESTLLDEAGTWHVFGRVAGASSRLTTVRHRFQVL
jgi:hypothetical protein